VCYRSTHAGPTEQGAFRVLPAVSCVVITLQAWPPTVRRKSKARVQFTDYGLHVTLEATRVVHARACSLGSLLVKY
jgi:hypothetical protein